jgi:hypothetical protein
VGEWDERVGFSSRRDNRGTCGRRELFGFGNLCGQFAASAADSLQTIQRSETPGLTLVENEGRQG